MHRPLCLKLLFYNELEIFSKDFFALEEFCLLTLTLYWVFPYVSPAVNHVKGAIYT
jgi:hypothetical protein